MLYVDVCVKVIRRKQLSYSLTGAQCILCMEAWIEDWMQLGFFGGGGGNGEAR